MLFTRREIHRTTVYIAHRQTSAMMTASRAAEKEAKDQQGPSQVGDRLDADSWHLDPILPPNAGEMVYEDLQPVAAAMQVPPLLRMCSFLEDLETRAFCSFADAECQVVQEGNEVSVFDDEELGVQVIELLGKRCSVAFPCSSILRHLCLHVKTLDKFFSFEVEIVDDTKSYRHVEITNTRSVADIGGKHAFLPLELSDGWQHINIDLERIVRLVFGTQYLTTSQVTLRASVRVAKVFFQEQQFSDYELPSHLRVVAE